MWKKVKVIGTHGTGPLDGKAFIVFADSSGTHNEYLHMIVSFRGLPVKEIGTAYLNSQMVRMGRNGDAIGKFSGKVRIIRNATGTELMESGLARVEPAIYAPHVYIRLKWDGRTFRKVPRISFKVNLDVRHGAH